MAYIFMDESGDLGFDFSKTKTSNNFLVTFFFCEDKNCFEKIVKKTFLYQPKDKMQRHCGVLHANHEHPKTKFKMLNLLAQKGEFSIMTIRLNKKRVYTKMAEEKSALYNHIVNLLLDRIINRKLCPHNEPINFIASKKDTNKFLNENFISYIEIQSAKKLDLKVEIMTPAQSKCLQIVDFISWSLFQKYEHNNESYYEVIKNFVVEDYLLFK